MKTSLHRIITKDHIELVGLLYEPDKSTTKALVHVHGMAGNFYENKFLDALAETLTSNGVTFFVFNNRGCEFQKDLIKIDKEGQDIVRIGNAYEIFEDSLLDIKSAVDFISSKGFSQIHLSGHSLGSPKVAYFAAEAKDSRLSSVIFISPSDMVGLFREEKDNERNMAVAEKMVKEGKGGELIPFSVLWYQNFISAQTYLSLGSEKSKVAIFNFYDPNDRLETLSNITIPAYAVMGRKDDVLMFPIEDVMNRIEKALTKSPKVKTEILGDAGHDYDGYEQQLADAINNWIQKV